jgi:hypothetical protein
LKTDGRKHSYAEKILMVRVAREFTAMKERLGAKEAAKQLNVSLASFYNYVAGTDLPRTVVLRQAHIKWGIKWPMLDLSEILSTRKVRSPEQLALSFIDAVREADVQVVTVGPAGQTVLQVKLRIHFQPSRVKNTIKQG